MNIYNKSTKIKFKHFGLLLLLASYFSIHVEGQVDGYWDMSVRERAEAYGFGYEEYHVTTEDGYILTLMRIPSGPESPPDITDKEPILMSHGSFTSGEMYTRIEGVDSPAFYLANQGKDVWLYNLRGNTYSRQHVSLDPLLDDEYWEFYMDTVRYDFMACVQFILDTTGYSQIATLSVSLGGALQSIAFALEPEYFVPRISISILIAPALNMAHTNAPVFAILGNYPWILETIRKLGVNVFNDDNYIIRWVTYQACHAFNPLCSAFYALTLDDENPAGLDNDAMDIFAARTANGIGIRLFEHLLQSTRSNQLTYFDYGIEENLETYGSELPPPIPLENINTPTALIWGEFDNTINEADREWMRDRLEPNTIFDHTYDG